MRKSTSVCYVAFLLGLANCGTVDDSSSGATVLDCPALDACHDAGTYNASTKQCSHPSKADGTPCSVATACADAGVCQSGVCDAGEPVVCPGTQGCNLGVCDPNSGCAVVALTGPCTPGLQAIALSGCTSGDYTAEVTLGTDQIFDMIVDSGSSTIAVAGAACSNCNAITPLYTPGSTATNAHSRASGAYGAASGWNGAVYNDLLLLAGDTNSTLSIDFVSIEQQSVESTVNKHDHVFHRILLFRQCHGEHLSGHFRPRQQPLERSPHHQLHGCPPGHQHRGRRLLGAVL